jgi:hypothetical protein
MRKKKKKREEAEEEEAEVLYNKKHLPVKCCFLARSEYPS